MTSPAIPFNRPTAVGSELAYMADAVARGHLSGDGEYTKRCSALLARAHDAPRALLTTSCTHALEMSALLLNIQPGDEVILPSFTFVSVVNAFMMRGARPVFIDIRDDTLNLDDRQLEALITARTRAVIAMHYAGVACEMDAIGEIASRHDVSVIEDNAHGLYGSYRGQALGTFGALSTLSFHETKNFVCGEGGALIINHAALVDRAEIIREKGTNRSKFFRGQVDKYSWVDVGSSYLPSEILAAFLLAQLEARDAIVSRRRVLYERYREALGDWGAANGMRLPVVPKHCQSTHHIFHLLARSLTARTALIAHLRAAGILAVFHYLPLHLSPMGRGLGGAPGDCPVAEDISDRLVRLPLYHSLSDDDQGRVIAALLEFSA